MPWNSSPTSTRSLAPAPQIRQCRQGQRDLVGSSSGARDGTAALEAEIAPYPDLSIKVSSRVLITPNRCRLCLRRLRKWREVGLVPILLRKSLAAFVNSDFVTLMRFAVEVVDDGAA